MRVDGMEGVLSALDFHNVSIDLESVEQFVMIIYMYLNTFNRQTWTSAGCLSILDVRYVKRRAVFPINSYRE